MTDILECSYTPGQLALIIGVSQTNIRFWVEQGALKANRETKRMTIKLRDLCEFLAYHRDLVGQLYFEDNLILLNEIRHIIIEEVDRIGF